MLYHISEDKNLSVLSPRVPDIAVTIYEDTTTPRVCLSESIDGCLASLYAEKGKEYSVYVTVGDFKMKYPTTDEVNDCLYTQEVWALEDVHLKHIGTVEVIDYAFIDNLPSYGKKDTTAVCKCAWRWICHPIGV